MAGLTKITSSEGGTKIQQSQEDIHVKFIILITIFLFGITSGLGVML